MVATRVALVAIDGDNVDRTLYRELSRQLVPAALVGVVQSLLPDHRIWIKGFYTVPMQDEAMSRQQEYFDEADRAGIEIKRWRRGSLRGRTIGYPDTWVMDAVRAELNQFDTLVLVTADRDYTPLLVECGEHGKDVVVLSPQPVAWPPKVTVHELDWLETQHPYLMRVLRTRPSWVLLGDSSARR